jgi:hypothetical protein
MCINQGVQSGRLFTSGSFSKQPHFSAIFIASKSCVSILAENVLGYILGDFLINSPGHPGSHRNRSRYTWKRELFFSDLPLHTYYVQWLLYLFLWSKIPCGNQLTFYKVFFSHNVRLGRCKHSYFRFLWSQPVETQRFEMTLSSVVIFCANYH